MYNLFSKEMEEELLQKLLKEYLENELTYFGKLFRFIF